MKKILVMVAVLPFCAGLFLVRAAADDVALKPAGNYGGDGSSWGKKSLSDPEGNSTMGAITWSKKDLADPGGASGVLLSSNAQEAANSTWGSKDLADPGAGGATSTATANKSQW